MEFRYELRKGSKKDQCPNCKRKTFKPYIDSKTKKEAGEKYGRCERVNSCGYCNYPKTDKNDNYDPPVKKYEPIKPTEYIDTDLVNKTFTAYNQNKFVLYLYSILDIKIVNDLIKNYNIGTANQFGTIYWQKDLQGRYRTGKVMYYNNNGKRSKLKNSWFAHSKIHKDFNFKQCFFGLHLVNKDTPVALCESEKTAVLMSVYMPEYTWIASGGSEMLNLQRLNELPRLDKVFADGGQFEKWEMKTRHFVGREMDISVDKAIKDGLIPEGSDILDLIQLKVKL